MKRYKLLKDTPTVKAGAIFEEEGTFHDEKRLVQVTKDGCLLSPWVVVRDIINFDEWFEEIHEYKRRRAEIGDLYYFIDDSGNVTCKYDYNNSWDVYHYATGNYGITKEELVAKRKYDIARQVLLDDAKGGRFTPDSNNYVGSYSCGTWDSTFVCNYFTGDIYFKTEEALKKSLEEHKEQWETVRKYEMGEM